MAHYLWVLLRQNKKKDFGQSDADGWWTAIIRFFLKRCDLEKPSGHCLPDFVGFIHELWIRPDFWCEMKWFPNARIKHVSGRQDGHDAMKSRTHSQDKEKHLESREFKKKKGMIGKE